MTTRFTLEESSHGGLVVYEFPEPGRQYVVGVDAAGGKARGDFAAMCVVDGESCALVARWKDKEDPHVWGLKSTWIAEYYNLAMLGIETGAGAHGQTAALAALNDAKYERIYRHIDERTMPRRGTDLLGWPTNGTTKPLMIDRVKRALADGCAIPDEELLQEIRDQRHPEDKNGRYKAGEMESDGHDDLVMAYAVALMVRDHCWTRGLIKIEAPKPRTFEEIYWHEREKALTKSRASGPKRRRWGNLRVG